MKMNALGIAAKEFRAFHKFLKSLNGVLFLHKINMSFAVLANLQVCIRNKDAVFTARQAFDINGVCGKTVGKSRGSQAREQHGAGHEPAHAAGPLLCRRLPFGRRVFLDGEAW